VRARLHDCVWARVAWTHQRADIIIILW
jgi:hypothetical protein